MLHTIYYIKKYNMYSPYDIYLFAGDPTIYTCK